MLILPRSSLSTIYSKVHPLQLLRVHSGVRHCSLQWHFIQLPCFPGQTSPSPVWFSKVTFKINPLCIVPCLSPLLFHPRATVLAPHVGLQMRHWVLEPKTGSLISQMAMKSTLLMVSGWRIPECGRSGWGWVDWSSLVTAALEQNGGSDKFMSYWLSCLRSLEGGFKLANCPHGAHSIGQQTAIKAFRRFLHPEA